VEITVNLQGLRPRLGTSKEITIEVRPNVGAVLVLSRTTPAELTAVIDLQ
jgi:archaellin